MPDHDRHHASHPIATRALCLAIAGSTLIWTVAGPGARPAAADTARLTIRYTCSFPPLGSQPLTARIQLTGSRTIPVGRATPRLPIDASATTTATVTGALGAIGATTVDGTVDATASVASPEGNRTVPVPLTVPRTRLPASGPLTVRASGTTPTLVFHRPGRAEITVGGLVMHLTPRNASGEETVVGEVTITCQVNPGQNLVLTSFTLTAPRPAAPPRTTTGAATGSPNRKPAATKEPASPSPTDRASSATPTATSSATPTTTLTTTAAPSAGATPTSDLAVATVATTTRPVMRVLFVACGVVALFGAAVACVWWRRSRRARLPHPDR